MEHRVNISLKMERHELWGEKTLARKWASYLTGEISPTPHTPPTGKPAGRISPPQRRPRRPSEGPSAWRRWGPANGWGMARYCFELVVEPKVWAQATLQPEMGFFCPHGTSGGRESNSGHNPSAHRGGVISSAP